MSLHIHACTKHDRLPGKFSRVTFREVGYGLFLFFLFLRTVDAYHCRYRRFNGAALIFQIVPDNAMLFWLFGTDLHHLCNALAQTVALLSGGIANADGRFFQEFSLPVFFISSIPVICRDLMPADI